MVKTWQNGGVDNNWSTAGNWAEGSKPAAGDDVVMSAAYNCTVNEATANLRSFDMTGYANTLTMSGNINVVGTAAATTVVKFAGTVTYSSGTLNLNPPATATLNLTAGGLLGGVPITIAGTTTGAVVCQDALNISTATLTLTSGTFNSNAQAVTCAALATSGSTARTLTITNSAVNLSGTGTVYNAATSTNLTVNSVGSVISTTDTSASSKTFAGGGKSYGGLTVGTGSGGTIITGTNTFQQTVTVAAGGKITFPSAVTTTLGGFITLGTSVSGCTVDASSAGSAATLLVYNSSATVFNNSYWYGDYVSVKDITWSTSGINSVADLGKNSTLVSGTTNITILAVVSTVAGGNWGTGATWSGGVAPGATDNVAITPGGTVTVDGDYTFGSSPAASTYSLIIGGTLAFGTLAANRTMTVNGGITVAGGGDVTGDANGYLGQILINNGTTDSKYYFTTREFGGFHLTDGGARTNDLIRLTAQASSGQANLVVDTDVSADWKAGDRVIVCNNAYNAAPEVGTILSIAGTTITLTGNLSLTHAIGADGTYPAVVMLSRGWTVGPTNTSYKIGALWFLDSNGYVNCDNVLFRYFGKNASNYYGMYLYAGALFDNCAQEGNGSVYVFYLQYTQDRPLTNWLFYAGASYGTWTGSLTNFPAVGCKWIATMPRMHNSVGSSYTNCYINYIASSGSAFTNMNVLSSSWNTIENIYQAFDGGAGMLGFTSTNDTFINVIRPYFPSSAQISTGVITNDSIGDGAYQENSPGSQSYRKILIGGKNASNYQYHLATISGLFGKFRTCGATLTDTKTSPASALCIGLLTAGAAKYDTLTRSRAISTGIAIGITGYMQKNSAYGSSTLPRVAITTDDAVVSDTATMTDVTDTWEAFTADGLTTGATTLNIAVSGSSANGSKAYWGDMYLYLRQYGKIYSTTSLSAINFIADLFSYTDLATNSWTTLDVATAYAQTGIAYDGSEITISENHTLLEIYQYFQAWGVQAANRASVIPFDTVDGVNFTSTANFTISTGVLVTGGGSIDCGSGTFTLTGTGDYDGVYLDTTGRNVAISLTGLTSGSRVQIYDNDATSELFNDVVAATTKKHWLVYSADAEIRLRVMYVNGTSAKGWYTYTGDVTSSGMNVVVTQTDNTVYNNNAIDGSTVTECSVSGSTIRIYVDDPDNTTSGQRIYNWYQYILFTESGIADQDGAYVSATDSTHYIFDDSMKIINQDLVNPLNLTGANIVPTTGAATNIFDLTNGASIALNYERVEYAANAATVEDITNAGIIAGMR